MAGIGARGHPAASVALMWLSPELEYRMSAAWQREPSSDMYRAGF
jgi:hypothetical protein